MIDRLGVGEILMRAKAGVTGRHWHIVPAMLLSVHAVGCGAPAQTPDKIAPRPKLVFLSPDLSGSRKESDLAQERMLAQQVVQGLSFGDKLVVVPMLWNGVTTEVSPKAYEMPAPVGATPTSFDQQRLEDKRRGVIAALPQYFTKESIGRAHGTDILSTLHTVASLTHEPTPRQITLVLLSDMKQQAKGVDMARSSGVPPTAWIASQKQGGMVPDLRNVCVVVVGADPTTDLGVRIRNFWQAYFQAAGTELPATRYAPLAPEGAPVGC